MIVREGEDGAYVDPYEAESEFNAALWRRQYQRQQAERQAEEDERGD